MRSKSDPRLLLARQMLEARRLRGDYLGNDLFREPAWDLLLVLYVAWCEGRSEMTTALFNKAGLPPATAIRWLHTLERKGLVERSVPENNRRVSLVTLSSRGAREMDSFLLHVASDRDARSRH